MSADPQPVVIKFPPKPKTENPLILPRRRLRSPFEVSEATAETQKTIDAIRSATRNPWGEPLNVDQQKMADLEKSLRQLTQKLEERERSLQDLEVRLTEREREVAEMENLLHARESLLEAAKNKNAGADARPLSHEEQAALEKLKTEIERQQKLLLEQREGLREREAFLDDSETKLFEKVQEQQEKETELEQREDELNQRERRLREREAVHDPVLAAKIAAEKAAASKPRGEFAE